MIQVLQYESVIQNEILGLLSHCKWIIFAYIFISSLVNVNFNNQIAKYIFSCFLMIVIILTSFFLRQLNLYEEYNLLFSRHKKKYIFALKLVIFLDQVCSILFSFFTCYTLWKLYTNSIDIFNPKFILKYLFFNAPVIIYAIVTAEKRTLYFDVLLPILLTFIVLFLQLLFCNYFYDIPTLAWNMLQIFQLLIHNAIFVMFCDYTIQVINYLINCGIISMNLIVYICANIMVYLEFSVWLKELQKNLL